MGYREMDYAVNQPGASASTDRLMRSLPVLNNLRVDEQRGFWIGYPEADEDSGDIREDVGQMGTEVKIVSPTSHIVLTIVEEYAQ